MLSFRLLCLAAAAAATLSTTTNALVAPAATTTEAPIVAIQENILDNIADDEVEIFDDAVEENASVDEENPFPEEEEETASEVELYEESVSEEEEEAMDEASVIYESKEEAVIEQVEAEYADEEETVVAETPCPESQEEETVVAETPCPESQEEETVVEETPCPESQEEETVIEETPCPESQEEETVIEETPCPESPEYYEEQKELITEAQHEETEAPCEIEVPEPTPCEIPVPEPTTPCVIDVEDPIVEDPVVEDPASVDEPAQCMTHALLASENVNTLIQRVCGVENEDNSGLQCNIGGVYPTASNADGVACPADFTIKEGDMMTVCCAAPEEEAEAVEEGYSTTNLAASNAGGLSATETALAATGAVAGVCALAGAAVYMRRKQAQNSEAYAISTPGDNII